MKSRTFAETHRAVHGSRQPCVESLGARPLARRLEIRQILRGPILQSKLVLGAPDDIFEQEAERVADRIMHMPEPALQRQDETEDEEEEFLQTKSAERSSEISPLISEDLEHIKSGGQPIDPQTRAYFEPRFGVDFGEVRIHADDRAAAAAQAIRAQAFTLGRHIVFGEGRYVPNSDTGKRLLAHELAHVLQQSSSAPRLCHPLESDPSHASPHRVDSNGIMQYLRSPEQQLQRSPGRPSPVVPDLDDATVSELERSIPMARADFLRQQMVDAIVSDRRRKGVDFSIMEGNRPRYDSDLWRRAMQQLPADQRSLPHNGITIHPQSTLNPGSLPLVLIGPSAFGPLTDPSNRELVRGIVVRLYTAMTHEYRHATQWQRPAQAQAMGQVGREVDAFFADIENSRATGLAGQRMAFRHTWDEVLSWWRRLRQSANWNALSDDQRRDYLARCRRVFTLARQVLGTSISSPCGP